MKMFLTETGMFFKQTLFDIPRYQPTKQTRDRLRSYIGTLQGKNSRNSWGKDLDSGHRGPNETKSMQKFTLVEEKATISMGAGWKVQRV